MRVYAAGRVELTSVPRSSGESLVNRSLAMFSKVLRDTFSIHSASHNTCRLYIFEEYTTSFADIDEEGASFLFLYQGIASFNILTGTLRSSTFIVGISSGKY